MFSPLLKCPRRVQRVSLCYIPPDGLVEGAAEDLVAVLGEAQTGHALVVGVLESAQAQTTLDLPHLTQQHTQTHIFNRMMMCYLKDELTATLDFIYSTEPSHFCRIEPLFCHSELQSPVDLHHY